MSSNNTLGHGLFVVGGITAMVGLGGSCYQIGQYDSIFTTEMYCSRNMATEGVCQKMEEDKSRQHKVFGAWAGVSILAAAVGYAGHKIRERGSY